jgi:hypothetical protein
VAVLRGHAKPVAALSWGALADAKGALDCVASASWDGSVCVWQRAADYGGLHPHNTQAAGGGGGAEGAWRCVRQLRETTTSNGCALYAVAWRPQRTGAPSPSPSPSLATTGQQLDCTQLASGGADGTPCSDAKVANRNGRGFGWDELTRPFRDARRSPSTRL